jgi:penicillin-binding protein 1A
VPGTNGKEHFPVKNFENKYAGSQTLAGGLTYSDNSVYAAVGIDVGTKKIARLAERMGIRTPVSSNYAMTLGGLNPGVTPLDMAHAYETLIAGGRRMYGSLGAGNQGPVGIKEVEQPNGKKIENETKAKRVLPAKIADETVSIMTTVVSQGTGRRAALGPGTFAAGKTGTTENFGDAWFIGFDTHYTVAVWVGYPDGIKPMRTEYGGSAVEGGTYPAEIWQDFMTRARDVFVRRHPHADLTDPSGQPEAYGGSDTGGTDTYEEGDTGTGDTGTGTGDMGTGDVTGTGDTGTGDVTGTDDTGTGDATGTGDTGAGDTGAGDTGASDATGGGGDAGGGGGEAGGEAGGTGAGYP